MTPRWPRRIRMPKLIRSRLGIGSDSVGMVLCSPRAGVPILCGFAQPIANDVEHQWVQAEGRAEIEADARPLFGEL